MTAIRKTSLQVAYFQGFTNLTTDLCTSNDRFGLKKETCPNRQVPQIYISVIITLLQLPGRRLTDVDNQLLTGLV